MNCREFAEFLDQYFEQTLPAGERAVFEGHLRVCPDCVRYLDGYSKTVLLTRALGAAPVPLGPPPEGLIEAILASSGKSARAV